MSGTHAAGRHGKPRSAREGEPGLMTRASRSLFSPVRRYGVITLVFLQLIEITVTIAVGAVLLMEQRADAAAAEKVPASTSPTSPAPVLIPVEPHRRDVQKGRK